MTARRVQEVLGLIQKNLECSICLELLKNPVSTRCDHQFCRFCIAEFLQTKSSVPCPLCKKPVTKRSLLKRDDLDHIVDNIRDLIAAFQEDSGTIFSPPRGPRISQTLQNAPDQVQVKETKLRKKNVRHAPARRRLESPDECNESTNSKSAVESITQNMVGGQDKYSCPTEPKTGNQYTGGESVQRTQNADTNRSDFNGQNPPVESHELNEESRVVESHELNEESRVVESHELNEESRVVESHELNEESRVVESHELNEESRVVESHEQTPVVNNQRCQNREIRSIEQAGTQPVLESRRARMRSRRSLQQCGTSSRQRGIDPLNDTDNQILPLIRPRTRSKKLISNNKNELSAATKCVEEASTLVQPKVMGEDLFGFIDGDIGDSLVKDLEIFVSERKAESHENQRHKCMMKDCVNPVKKGNENVIEKNGGSFDTLLKGSLSVDVNKTKPLNLLKDNEKKVQNEHRQIELKRPECQSDEECLGQDVVSPVSDDDTAMPLFQSQDTTFTKRPTSNEDDTLHFKDESDISLSARTISMKSCVPSKDSPSLKRSYLKEAQSREKKKKMVFGSENDSSDSQSDVVKFIKPTSAAKTYGKKKHVDKIGHREVMLKSWIDKLPLKMKVDNQDVDIVEIVPLCQLHNRVQERVCNDVTNVLHDRSSDGCLCLNAEKGFFKDLSEASLETTGTGKRIFKSRNSVLYVPQSQIVSRSECDSDPYEFKSSQTPQKKQTKKKPKRKGRICKRKKANKVPLHILEKKNKDTLIDMQEQRSFVASGEPSGKVDVFRIETLDGAKSQSGGQQSGDKHAQETGASFTEDLEVSLTKTFRDNSILNGNNLNKKDKRKQTAKKVHWRDDGREMSLLIDKISEAEDHDILFSTQDAIENMVPENKIISVDVEESNYFDHEEDDDSCLIIRQEPDDDTDESNPEATSEDPLHQDTEAKGEEIKQKPNSKSILNLQAAGVTEDKKSVQNVAENGHTYVSTTVMKRTTVLEDVNLNQLQDSVSLEASKNVKPSSNEFVRKSETVESKQNSVDVSSVVAETPLLGAGSSELRKSSLRAVGDSYHSTQTPVQSSVNELPETAEEMKPPVAISPLVTIVAGTPQVGLGRLGQLCAKPKARHSHLNPNTLITNCTGLQELKLKNQTKSTQHIQPTSSQMQMTPSPKQKEPSEKIRAGIISSSVSNMQFTCEEWTHEERQNKTLAGSLASEKSLQDDVLNQQSKSDHEELLASSADSSSTEDLDTDLQDIQFEIPNLDLQPEDIRFQLSQLSEDIMSYDSCSNVMKVEKCDELSNSKCVVNSEDVAEGSGIILDASNDMTISESIDELGEVRSSKNPETQPRSSEEVSNKNKTKDCVDHYSHNEERKNVHSPMNSNFNQEYSETKILKTNKLKGKGVNSKSNVDSLFNKCSEDPANQNSNSPHGDPGGNNIAPITTNASVNGEVTTNKIMDPIKQKDCDSSVDSQGTTVLSLTSGESPAAVERALDSYNSNKNTIPESLCSMDIPCTCCSLSVNKSSQNKEFLHCSKHSLNSGPALEQCSKSSEESASTVFQTASDQSVSILAPVSHTDKDRTPQLDVCLGDQTVVTHGSSSPSCNGSKKRKTHHANVNQCQPTVDDKHSWCVKNSKEDTVIVETLCGKNQSSSGTTKSSKGKRKWKHNAIVDSNSSLATNNIQNLEDFVDSSTSLLQSSSSSTDSVHVISSNSVINNDMPHKSGHSDSEGDEVMEKDSSLDSTEVGTEKLSRKLRSSESSRLSGKRSIRKQSCGVNNNNINVASGKLQICTDISVSSGKSVAMPIASQYLVSSAELSILANEDEVQPTVDDDNSQCDVMKVNIEPSLCRKLRSLESSRSSGQKRKRKQKSVTSGNSSYKDTNEPQMSSEKSLPASGDEARILTTPSHLIKSVLKFKQVNSDPIPLVRDDSDEEFLQVRRSKRRCFSLDGSPVKPPEDCHRSRRCRNIKVSNKQDTRTANIDRNICNDKQDHHNPDVMMLSFEVKSKSCDNKVLSNSEIITEIPETLSEQRSSQVALSPDSDVICVSSVDTVIPSISEVLSDFNKKNIGLQDLLTPDLIGKISMHDELTQNTSIATNNKKDDCPPKSAHINRGENHNNHTSERDVCSVNNKPSSIVGSVVMKVDDLSEDYRKGNNHQGKEKIICDSVKLTDNNITDVNSVNGDDHDECNFIHEQNKECMLDNVLAECDTQLSSGHQYSISQDIFQKDASSSEQFSQDSVNQIGCENVAGMVPVTYDSSSNSEQSDGRLKSQKKRSRTVRGIASIRKSGTISTASSLRNVSSTISVLASPSEFCPTLNFSPCSGQSKGEAGDSCFTLNEGMADKSFEDHCLNTKLKELSDNRKSIFIARSPRERAQPFDSSNRDDDPTHNILAISIPDKDSILDSGSHILAETLRHRQLDFITPPHSKLANQTNAPRQTAPGDEIQTSEALCSASMQLCKSNAELQESSSPNGSDSSQLSGVKLQLQAGKKPSECPTVQCDISVNISEVTNNKSSRKQLDKNDLEEWEESVAVIVDPSQISNKLHTVRNQDGPQTCGSPSLEVDDSQQDDQIQHVISKDNKSEKSRSPVPVVTVSSHIGGVKETIDKHIPTALSEKLDVPAVTEIDSSDSEEFVLRDEDIIDYGPDFTAVPHFSDMVQVLDNGQVDGDDHELVVDNDGNLLVGGDEYGVKGDGDHLINSILDGDDDRDCSVDTDEDGDQLIDTDHSVVGVDVDGNCSVDTDRLEDDVSGDHLVDGDRLMDRNGDDFIDDVVDDHDLMVHHDRPDPQYGNLPLTSSPMEGDNQPALFTAHSSDDDESMDIPIRRKKKRWGVIEDSDEDSDLSEVSNTNHSSNLTSSSAFSSQSEVLTTQQKVLLETDCAKLKEKIRATEAKIKDLAVKAPGSVMKSKPATGKTDNEECDLTGSPQHSSSENKEAKDGNESTSSEDSDDLYLSPLPPTPPPPQDTTPLKPSAIVQEAVKILNKIRSPDQTTTEISKTTQAGLQSRTRETTSAASPAGNVFKNVKSANNSGKQAEKDADTSRSLTTLSTSTQSKCFVATGLCRNEVVTVKKLAENNDCKFYGKFNNRVTHVIVKTVDNENKRCDRTLKYFQGIAAKCFIVSFKWVADSLKAGRLLPEDRYEITGDTVSEEIHFGPTRSRSTTSKLFTGFSFTCVGVSTEMTKEDMVALLALCGARVADDPWELGVTTTGSTKLIIRCLDVEDNPPSLSEVDFFNSHYKHLGVVTVSREWALDSIGVYQIQPLADYLLTQIDKSQLPF